MNSTNATGVNISDPWVESGAMVYVALTVATFSAVTMCCTWYAKERWMRSTTYNTVETAEENVELTAHSESSEEDIPLDIDEDERPADDSSFTIDDRESGEDGSEDEREYEPTDTAIPV
tara:strand:+ start:4932 stop:5288 length:357 start_codon:yes stop_codon:yes gene_type:complete